MISTIDVKEEKWSKSVLRNLLIDRTTNKNILWGTNDYKKLGMKFEANKRIFSSLITGKYSNIIQPRVLKTKINQGERTKTKAEVFTPSWLCNLQNNLVDNAWFKETNVFNTEIDSGKSWVVNREKIQFPNIEGRTWKDYVKENRLEIACGEGPYLVSRYDSVSGKFIDIENRIGILDRKLRIVSENTETEKEWLEWTIKAFKSIYGFEFQGDSLLIARENILATFWDYLEHKLKRTPYEKELILISHIISWNLWQMDALTFAVPYENEYEQLNFFDTEEITDVKVCMIKDWEKNKKILFKQLVEGVSNE